MKFTLLPLFLVFGSFAQATGTTPETTFLSELVSISSGSLDASGVNRVQDKMAEKLKALGFSIELIEGTDASAHSGKALVATLKSDKAPSGANFITLIGHADTVFETLNPFKINSDGKIANGSGVVDDKGGLVVGFFALQKVLAAHSQALNLRMVISPSEETGSHGFQDLFKKYADDSAIVIGLEPTLDNGDYVSSRKGVRWYEIEVTGKESHAGAHHEEGINACHDLAIKLNSLQNLTQYSKGNTVSIGHMEGGKDKFNIVCGIAKAKIDSRFTTPEQEKILSKQIESILKKPSVFSAHGHEGSQTKFTVVEYSPPLPPASKETEKLMKKYVEIVKKLEGKDIVGRGTGGAGDLNYMYRPGAMVVDGFGATGGGMHTAEEFVSLESLVTRSQALGEFLEYLNETLSHGK
jgi:glutamate carboxypeptidase